MRRFDDHHPIAIFVWFLSVFALTMLTMHPVLLLTSLVCALAYRLLRSGRRSLRALLWLLPMFLLLCVLNPLLSHGGDTVLFFVNQTPFTLEATVYAGSDRVRRMCGGDDPCDADVVPCVLGYLYE